MRSSIIEHSALAVLVLSGAAAAQPCQGEWASLENLGGGGTSVDSQVFTLDVFDDGLLYAGGIFNSAGGLLAGGRVAAWNGQWWSPLGEGLGDSGTGRCLDMAIFNDGSGPALYAGGVFDHTGGFPLAPNVAKWDGQAWSSVGAGLGFAINSTPVNALAVFDDGSGPALYAGGGFDETGGSPFFAPNIAKWDGLTWSAVGSGLGTSGQQVRALTVFNDGTGPALYASGNFTVAGGVTVNRIAKWDGVSWSALGSGMDNAATALAVFNDGSGDALYAVGSFNTAGGVPASRIAKWNGQAWSAVGGGLQGFFARSLTVFDDGGGAALYAGGFFDTAGGVPESKSIAKWDGQSWSPLAPGINGSVQAIVGFDDGSGPLLYVGGAFSNAGGVDLAHNIARWGCDVAAPLYTQLTSADGAGGLPDYVPSNLAGQGRSVYFTANERFTIDGAGIRAVMDPGTYHIVIYQGQGSDAPAGPVLHQVDVPLGTEPEWQDAPMSFEFQAGQDYILHVRHSVPGTPVASEFTSMDWGSHVSVPQPIGVVTIVDGREGYNSENPADTSFPLMRLENVQIVIPCAADLDEDTDVDVFDLLVYLDLWFASGAAAERTGDDPASIDVFDLLVYLDEWFAGCN